MSLILAYAAAVAVACNMPVTESDNVQWPMTDVQKEMSETFVLDDEKRTVFVFNPENRSILPYCSDCDWDYGSAKISYVQGKRVPKYLEIFTIDREAGTIEVQVYESDTDARKARNYVRSGSCKKTDMPSLASNAKF